MSIPGSMLKAMIAWQRYSVDQSSLVIRALLLLVMLLHGTACSEAVYGDEPTPNQLSSNETIRRLPPPEVEGTVPIDLYSALLNVYGSQPIFNEGDSPPLGGVQFALGAEQLASPSGEESLSPPAPEQSDQEAPFSVLLEMDRINQRIKEIEEGRVAHEDATRTIIQNSLSARGSNITDTVLFGGTLEVLSGWTEDFDGVAESGFTLQTAELDFEILVNQWTLGSVIFQYDDGRDFALLSTDGDETFVERINVDTAFIVLGNTQRYPLFTTLGRIVVPFGISTGDPVTDALTINDPLTIEVFETKEDAWLIGFQYPNYCPPPPPTTPPRKYPTPRPILLNPLVSKIARRMPCYCRCPTKPKIPATFTRTNLCVPPLSGGIYFYNGDTIDGIEDHIQQMGGTLGYRTQGCTPFRNLPWTLDVDVDVTSSVFDSDFLQFEYRRFLQQIGFVTGMAAHVKSNIGPTSWIGEWNGAVDDAVFQDDLFQNHSLRPEAWQVQFVYQFDWNPAVEFIGLQGTYFVLGYSESQDMAGVIRVVDANAARVGFVPRKRFMVGMGEWVLDGLRVAVEYAHAVDYEVSQGGTGNEANSYFMQLTYEW